MNTIDYIVKRVSSKLMLQDSECDDATDRDKIIDALTDVFDRFSFDSRKLPIVYDVEIPVISNDIRQTIGNNAQLHMYDAPHTLYYAAWRHKPLCGCTYNNCCDNHKSSYTSTYWLGDELINIRQNVQEFYQENASMNHITRRPHQIWYQQSSPNGELVFNSLPYIGDTLYLRATIPFCVDLVRDCCNPKTCPEPEWEFELCPSTLPCDEKHRVLFEAQKHFNGCDGWTWRTNAKTCDPCSEGVVVTVTAKEKPKFYPSCIDYGYIDMPNGYTDSLIRIVTYDLAGEFGKKNTAKMKSDRDEAVMLMHRDNDRKRPIDFDYRDRILPWNNRYYG